MTVAGEAWQGQGSAGPDGRLQFEVSAPGVARPQRGGGRLW